MRRVRWLVVSLSVLSERKVGKITLLLMTPFLESALKAIDSPEPGEVAAGFLILGETVAFNCIGGFHSDLIPEANEQHLGETQIGELLGAVQRWIEHNPNHLHTHSAFWVLDKFRDTSLRSFLRRWLEHYIQRFQAGASPLGQILIALDSLGEPAISGRAFSAIDHEKNLDDAIRYLKATAAGN
jgi:hypothetical protein